MARKTRLPVRRRKQLGFERMEPRAMLAVYIVTQPASGSLQVTGNVFAMVPTFDNWGVVTGYEEYSDLFSESKAIDDSTRRDEVNGSVTQWQMSRGGSGCGLNGGFPGIYDSSGSVYVSAFASIGRSYAREVVGSVEATAIVTAKFDIVGNANTPDGTTVILQHRQIPSQILETNDEDVRGTPDYSVSISGLTAFSPPSRPKFPLVDIVDSQEFPITYFSATVGGSFTVSATVRVALQQSFTSESQTSFIYCFGSVGAYFQIVGGDLEHYAEWTDEGVAIHYTVFGDLYEPIEFELTWAAQGVTSRAYGFDGSSSGDWHTGTTYTRIVPGYLLTAPQHRSMLKVQSSNRYLSPVAPWQVPTLYFQSSIDLELVLPSREPGLDGGFATKNEPYAVSAKITNQSPGGIGIPAVDLTLSEFRSQGVNPSKDPNPGMYQVAATVPPLAGGESRQVSLGTFSHNWEWIPDENPVVELFSSEGGVDFLIEAFKNSLWSSAELVAKLKNSLRSAKFIERGAWAAQFLDWGFLGRNLYRDLETENTYRYMLGLPAQVHGMGADEDVKITVPVSRKAALAGYVAAKVGADVSLSVAVGQLILKQGPLKLTALPLLIAYKGYLDAARLAYETAKDPPDSAFSETVRLEYGPLDIADASRIDRDRCLLLRELAAYRSAASRAINKADGAALAKNSLWQGIQLSAAAGFTLEASRLQHRLGVLESLYPQTREAITESAVVAFKQRIAAEGFPADLADGLRDVGYSNDDIAAFTAALASLDPGWAVESGNATNSMAGAHHASAITGLFEGTELLLQSVRVRMTRPNTEIVVIPAATLTALDADDAVVSTVDDSELIDDAYETVVERQLSRVRDLISATNNLPVLEPYLDRAVSARAKLYVRSSGVAAVGDALDGAVSSGAVSADAALGVRMQLDRLAAAYAAGTQDTKSTAKNFAEAVMSRRDDGIAVGFADVLAGWAGSIGGKCELVADSYVIEADHIYEFDVLANDSAAAGKLMRSSLAIADAGAFGDGLTVRDGKVRVSSGFIPAGTYVVRYSVLDDATFLRNSQTVSLQVRDPADDDAAYVVTFDVQGGTAVAPSSKTVTFDSVYGTLPSPVKTGYTFAGWQLDGSGVTASTIVATAADHTLSATWTANTYVVTFDVQGGTAVDSSSKTVTFDSVYGTLPSPVKAGYTFAGWQLDGSGVTANSTVATAADHTLSATWTIDATVITLTVSPASVTEDGDANLLYTFTRTGSATSALLVNYTVGGTATLGTDYTGISAIGTTKTITFAAGSTSAMVTVDPAADTTAESHETVILTITSGIGYTIGTTTVTGTITNDDQTSPTAIAVLPIYSNLPKTPATGTAARIAVAEISVDDDGQGTNVLSLSGPQASDFEVRDDGLNGFRLYLKAGVVLDPAIQAVKSVTVSVRDSSLSDAPVSATYSASITDEATRLVFGQWYGGTLPSSVVARPQHFISFYLTGAAIDAATLSLADFVLTRDGVTVPWTAAAGGGNTPLLNVYGSSGSIDGIGHLTAAKGAYEIRFTGNATDIVGTPLRPTSLAWTNTAPVSRLDGANGWALLITPTTDSAWLILAGMTVADDGSAITFGSFSGTVDFDSRPDSTTTLTSKDAGSGESGFVARFNAAGVLVAAWSIDAAISAIATSGSRVTVGGTFMGTGVDLDPRAAVTASYDAGSDTAFFLLSFDSASGQPSATHVYPAAPATGGGGSSWGSSSLTAITTAADGRLFFSGRLYSASIALGSSSSGPVGLSVPADQSDSFVAALAANGSPLWAQRLQNGSTNSYSTAVPRNLAIAQPSGSSTVLALGVTRSATLGIVPGDAAPAEGEALVIGLDATSGAYRWRSSVITGAVDPGDSVPMTLSGDGRLHAAANVWTQNTSGDGRVESGVITINSATGERIGAPQSLGALLGSTANVYVSGLLPRADNSVVVTGKVYGGAAGADGSMYLLHVPASTGSGTPTVTSRQYLHSGWPSASGITADGRLIFTSSVNDSDTYPTGSGFALERLISPNQYDAAVWSIRDPFATSTPTGINVPTGQTITDTTIPNGSYQLIKQGGGTLILNKANAHSGGTVVEAGEVVVRNIAALGAATLDVRAGAKVTIDVGSANWNGGVNYVQLSRLDLNPSGRLELGAGQICVAAGGYDLAAIRSALSAGRGDGSWNGSTGFTSAVAGSGASRAIGYTVLPNGSLQLGFAATGDMNVDGVVDFDDVVQFVSAGLYDKGLPARWDEGDLDYNGVVDFDDVVAMVSAGLYDTGTYLPTQPVSSAAVNLSALAEPAMQQLVVSQLEPAQTTPDPTAAAFASLSADQTFSTETSPRKKQVLRVL